MATIHEKVSLAGIAICLGLTLVAGTFVLDINKIRLGGPLANQNQIASDLLADVLPPPEYLIEAYLEATLLVREPASLGRRSLALKKLEQDYRSRAGYWHASRLDADLKSALENGSGATAKSFWTELNSHLVPSISRGDHAAASASYLRLQKIYAAHRSQVDNLVTMASARQQTLISESKRVVASTILMMSLIGLALLSGVAGAVVYLLRRVLRPIGDTADAMSRMADGELNVSVGGQGRADEIGAMASAIEVFRDAAFAQRQSSVQQEFVVATLKKGLKALEAGDLTFRISVDFTAEYKELKTSFNRTMETLNTTLGHVMNSAVTVAAGATQIRSASDDLSRRTEQQACALEKSTSTLDKITKALRATANSAVEADHCVSQARTDAAASDQIMAQAISAMDEIERRSREISDIISLIEGIAFQTNLLALNAGVEAARAGEAGKGFAVVAAEVRALAHRSAEAAKEVSSRIKASAAEVKTGTALVGDAGSALSRVIQRIDDISTVVASIATSAESQTLGLQHVNNEIAEMDSVTLQNAAMVEQATAAARSLASEADLLSQEITRFHLTEQHSSRAPVSLAA